MACFNASGVSDGISPVTPVDVDALLGLWFSSATVATTSEMAIRTTPIPRASPLLLARA